MLWAKILKFFDRGGLPTLRNCHGLPLVVPLPVTAVTQRQELDSSKLINIAQRQIRPLPQRMDMMDRVCQCRQGRSLALAVIAQDARPAITARPENGLSLGLPLARGVKGVDIICRNKRQHPARRPGIRVKLRHRHGETG